MLIVYLLYNIIIFYLVICFLLDSFRLFKSGDEFLIGMQSVRQIGKLILEEVSHTQGLANGLKFLCSDEASRSASFLGLKHGLKLVGLYCASSYLAQYV